MKSFALIFFLSFGASAQEIAGIPDDAQACAIQYKLNKSFVDFAVMCGQTPVVDIHKKYDGPVPDIFGGVVRQLRGLGFQITCTIPQKTGERVELWYVCLGLR